MKDMQTWVDFAKQQKSWAVDSTNRGDIPPTIIVERDGEVLAIVISPEIDKRYGLQAASMCQAGFDPDALTMVVDAHIHQGKRQEGQTMEEAQEEYHKKFPKGMQHACDTEGACATGEITDCLVYHRITRDGKITMVTLPYSYHGKDGGVPFQWLDGDERYKDMGNMSETSEGVRLEGFIPDSLREIMKSPSFFQQIPQLQEVAKANEFTPERVRYHTSRAIMAMMTAKKYMVADFVSGRHPEWTGAKETGNEMLSKMIEGGFFPKEAYEPIKEIIDKHIGTRVFADKLTALLTVNSYWLPGEIREDIPKFVSELESICMSPSIPNGFGDEDEDEDGDGDEDEDGDEDGDEAEPKRVRVWNGDQSEFLGEGNYVGNVAIYAIEMPDGSIQSNTNAEVEPEDVPEGGVVRKMNNNPKIVLDNGQTVYGCQVWWEPVKEPVAASAASPHQHGPGCKHNH